MRILLILFGILILAATAYAISDFLVEGNPESEFINPPTSTVYIEIPRLHCAISARMNLSPQFLEPMPRIDIGGDNNFEFASLEPLDQEIRWLNDWCGDPESYECDSLVKAINRYLTICNEEPGDDPCMVPMSVENQIEDGVTRVSDLSVNVIEAYTGPIFGGQGYTCDLGVVCDEGDESSCVIGQPADAVLTLQYTNTMRDSCDYSYDGSFSSPCDGNDEFISRLQARNLGAVSFVETFFELTEGNKMGIIPHHATNPRGQARELTVDQNVIINYIEGEAIGEPPQLCLSCIIREATDMLHHPERSRPDAVKSILLMTDGFTNKCILTSDGGLGATCQGRPPLVSREDASRQEAIEEAQRVYEEYGVIINVVAYEQGPEVESFVEAIANAAGGRYYYGTDVDELIEFYESVAREVSGDCEGLCEFYIGDPDPRCGDGLGFDEEAGQNCDWGDDQNRLTCEPTADGRCEVCLPRGTRDSETGELIECTLRYFYGEDADEDEGDDGEPDRTYCGDGFVQGPPDGNDDGIEEQCDRGEDVNTDIPCTPIPGGNCTICNLQCQLEEFDSTLPFVGECEEVDIMASYPAEIFLNDYVGALSVDSLFDLTWSVNSFDPDMDPVIIANNVLRVQSPGYVIVDVKDDDGSTDQGCFEFRSVSALYDRDDDPTTRLLIRQGRIVSGYIERPLSGEIEPWGPYRITAEVWQR